MNETPRFSAPPYDGNGLEPGRGQGRKPAHRLCPRGVATGNHTLLVAFRDGLSAVGWIDGSNVSVIERWTEEHTEVQPVIIKELIGSGATILVTARTLVALAATRANATIPIILVGVDDPVFLGLVDALMQPGGNVTGLSLSSSEVIAERLELLRHPVPGLHRLAVIVRDDPGLDQKLQDIRSNAERKGIETLMLEATTAKAVELAFARLRGDRAQAIYVASGPLGPVKRARIIALA
jgi:putative ABC transport system substrate-binding protein